VSKQKSLTSKQRDKLNLSKDWAYIEKIASERLKHNKTEHHVSKYGTDIELLGAAGEFAARRFLGLPETLHTHFDGGADIAIGGLRIDVKATVWTPALSRRYLQWPYWKPIRSNIILMTAVLISAQTARIVGYATTQDILAADMNLERFTPCYEIPITDLRKAQELLNERKKRLLCTVAQTTHI
jgi:hypothetical protein